jgi:hypothetical protein
MEEIGLLSLLVIFAAQQSSRAYGGGTTELILVSGALILNGIVALLMVAMVFRALFRSIVPSNKSTSQFDSQGYEGTGKDNILNVSTLAIGAVSLLHARGN